MKLSKRLEAIASCVDKGVILADIGSDHAYIPCALALRNQIKHAYACDVSQGPLKHALDNIMYYEVDEIVETRLCNGLTQLQDDVEEIIIAGMGFDTIQMILEQSFEKLSNYRKIIVQSNTNVNELRKWISDHHFHILDEKIVYETFYYQIICFNCEYGETLSEEACEYGVMLDQDPLFPDYLRYRLKQVEEVLSHLPDHHVKKAVFMKRKNQIQTKLRQLSN